MYKNLDNFLKFQKDMNNYLFKISVVLKLFISFSIVHIITRTGIKLTVWVLLVATSAMVQASTLSQQIITAATATLGHHYSAIQLEHSPLDVKFTNCNELQFHSIEPLNLGRQYIKLSGCGYHNRIAITLSALVAMPIASSTISKNTVLSAEHFSVQQIKIDKKLKYFVAFDAVIGRTTSKQTRKGKWITEKSLQKDYLVARGSLVSYRIEQHGFIVTTEMLALDNGLFGQVIRVRHPISRKKLTAVVRGHNQVTALNR